MATVFCKNITTGKVKILVNNVSAQQALREKMYFIKRLYDTDKYDDHVILIKS